VSFKYDIGRSLGTAGWLSSNIRSLLVNAVYVPNPAHQFITDIPVGAIAIRGPLLTNKSVLNGFVRASTTRYADLLLPQEIKGLIMYVDTGVDATSSLILYADDAPSFPFTPVGFNYDFGYDAIAGGFYRT
jgi:hypothetical protein